MWQRLLTLTPEKFIQYIREGGYLHHSLDELRGVAPFDSKQYTQGFSPGQHIPVVGSAAASFGYDSGSDGPPQDYVERGDIINPDAIAFRVEGDSMEPKYSGGDTVIGIPAKLPIKSGSPYIVRMTPEYDDEVTFKFVVDKGGDSVILVPANDYHDERTIPKAAIAALYIVEQRRTDAPGLYD